MSLTESTEMPRGTIAPEFALLDVVSGKQRTLSELRSEIATVIVFTCNHCPYVIHIESCFLQLAREYQAKGVAFIAICANDAVTYPDDAPAQMALHADAKQFPFPYLHDPTQAVAKAYAAACTPEFYVFDGALACIYHGCFDRSRPGNNTPVTGEHLAAALDAALLKRTFPESEWLPAMGCNIKWR